MRIATVLWILLAACGGPATTARSSNTRPLTQPAAQSTETETIEDIATRFGRAALAGDRPTALSLTLSFEELSSISAKAAERTKAEWDSDVADFLDGLAREGREAGASLNVVGANVVNSGTLKKGEDSKVLRDIEFAFVQLVIEQDGREAQPQGVRMIFLKTEAGWRFSPRQ